MKRLMRLRGSQHLRDLCAETEFNRAQLIQPFFVVEGLNEAELIPGLRGNVRHNISSALQQIEKDLAEGVTQFLLFPVPATTSGFVVRMSGLGFGSVETTNVVVFAVDVV